MIKVSAMSRDYLRVAVSHRHRSADELTIDLVEFAFTEQPVDADWHPGSWEVEASLTGKRAFARVLVGPGATQLTRGIRPVLVRITDNPERPVRRVGYLVVI
jgi:hypothetical protein